jgi:hypothetical protein
MRIRSFSAATRSLFYAYHTLSYKLPLVFAAEVTQGKLFIIETKVMPWETNSQPTDLGDFFAKHTSIRYLLVSGEGCWRPDALLRVKSKVVVPPKVLRYLDVDNVGLATVFDLLPYAQELNHMVLRSFKNPQNDLPIMGAILLLCLRQLHAYKDMPLVANISASNILTLHSLHLDAFFSSGCWSAAGTCYQ